jgi:hypothetical protein
MNRFATFLLLMALATVASAQGREARPPEIPPGPSYDPAKHVNPLITYVQAKDFKVVPYKEAQDAVDFPLLGVSKETGSIDTIAVAEPPVDASKELKLDVKATFYPVVRQIFKITNGGEVALYSFKPPRVQENPFARLSVGGMRGTRGPNPKQKRFGSVQLPEEMEVRGLPGLMFEDGKTLTIVWLEEGVTHAATSGLSKKALFDVIDDLL